MMEKDVLVYVDLDGVPHLVGRLWARVRKNKEGATFEYNKAWLEHPNRFSLEPALKLGPGPFHTVADTPMFGAIGDSAPDRWGRALMRRMERRRAEREGRAPRTLHEMDYLLLVDDEARAGALRFAETEGGPFLRQEEVKRIPPLVELPKLLSATEHVIDETDTEEDLRLQFAPLGVELNKEKTKVVDTLKGEAFGFLGFDLRRARKRKGNGHYLQMTPKKKARKAIKAKGRDIIRHSGATPMAMVVAQINASLAGWVNYFRVGNASRAFSEVRD